MALETPSRPPPFMANAILNFHFDYLTPSLSNILSFCVKNSYMRYISALDSVRETLSIFFAGESSVVTASFADSPRSIKQAFNGLWPILSVLFFCQTKSLKVVFDHLPVAN